MPPRPFALTLLLLLSIGSQAHAATAKKRVAVMEVRAVGTFDPKAVQGLATLMASEAEELGFKVLSPADIQTVVGFERQKQLIGCSDGACLAEIGGALGTEYLLSSEVSEIGGIWLLTVTLYDVARSQQALKRVTRKVKKVGELVDSAQACVGEALTPFSERPPASAPRTGEEARIRAAVPASGGSALRTAGIALDVAGAALLAGGAVCGVLTLTSYEQGKTASPEQLPGLRSSGKAQALAADVLFGVGAAALATGLVLTFVGSGAGPAVSAAPLPGGGALAVSGRF